jgi:hypothetical protein
MGDGWGGNPPPRRKCEEPTKAGDPCKNWAVLESDPPQCNVHAGSNVNADDASARARAKAVFLDIYSRTGDNGKASSATDYKLRTIRSWRRQDATFANEWDEVKQDCVQDLEASLWQRGCGLEVIEVTEAYDKDMAEMIVVKQLTKTIFDTAAAALWLRGNEANRYRDSNHQQPPAPRRTEDEDVIKGIMADDSLRHMMNQLLDADIGIGREALDAELDEAEA